MRLGIIAALGSEAGVFRRARGTLPGGDDYLVTVGGPGPGNGAHAATAMLGEGCDTLLSWGVAGALADDLRAGDVIVAARVMSESGAVLEFDPTTAERVVAPLGHPPWLRNGTVMSCATTVARSADKAALQRRYQADAVDLESSAIASVAHAAGCGFVLVRAIVDEACFELPPAALTGVGSDGGVRLTQVLASVCAQPRQLAQLIRLARHFNRALRGLRQVAQAITP